MSDEETEQYSRVQRKRDTLASEYSNILAEIFDDDCGISHAIEQEAYKQYGKVIERFRADPEAEIKDELWYMLGREYSYE